MDPREEIRKLMLEKNFARLQEYYKDPDPKHLIRPRPEPKPLKEGELPPVGPPAMFMPDIPVAGPPHVAQLVKRLGDLDPRVKANVKNVVVAPITGTVARLRGSGFAPEEYARTNLGGQYDLRSQQVTINPRTAWTRDAVVEALAHEPAHAAGVDDPWAYGTEDLLKKPK